MGRARNPGSQGRHQSAVGRVGKQTPEKCVSGEEGKKEHPLLVTNILCNDRHRSILGDFGDGHFVLLVDIFLGEGVGVNKLFRNSARVMGAGVGKLFVLLNINVIKSNMFSLGLRFLKRAL